MSKLGQYSVETIKKPIQIKKTAESNLKNDAFEKNDSLFSCLMFTEHAKTD